MIRKYKDLSEQDKKKAINKCLLNLITDIVDGIFTFDDSINEEPLQAKIDLILKKSEAERTPWFAAEMIMQDEWLSSRLESIACVDAQEALYPEANDIIIRI